MRTTIGRFTFVAAALSFAVACGGDDPVEDDSGADTSEDTVDDTQDADLDVAPDTDAEDVALDPMDDTADATDTTDVAMDSDADAPDTDLPCETWPVIPETATTAASPDGVDPATRVAGDSVAGILTTGDGGFFGPYAACGPGHYVIANDNVRFCIAGDNAVGQYLFGGGYIVDAQPGDGGTPDGILAIIPSSQLMVQAGDSIEVVADGSDGGAAVIRVAGVDLTPRIVAAVVGMLLVPKKVEFITEYRLAPDALSLEVVTWIQRDGASAGPVIGGDLLLGGDEGNVYWGSGGLNVLASDMDLFASIAPGQSVGIASEGMLDAENISIPLISAPLVGVRMVSGRVCEGESASYRRFVSVADGGTPELRDLLLPGVRAGTDVQFATTPGLGWSNPRVQVFATDAGEVDLAMDVVRLDDLGAGLANLPDGPYRADLVDWPQTQAAPDITFTVPGDTVMIPNPSYGSVSTEIADGDGAPIGARVEFVGAENRVFYALAGADSVPLEPGDYTYTVSRGDEYSIATGAFTLAEGDVATVSATLDHVLDTTGWVSGDFHQHSTPSIDSGVQLNDRVRANVAAGLDFIAPSDHDSLGDFVGALDELGLTGAMHLFHGTEISPVYGHINAFPLTYDRSLDAFGAVPLGRRLDGRNVESVPMLETLDAARGLGVEVIQVNHPRDSQGYFDWVNFDPVIGPSSADVDGWSTQIDMVEVMNGADDFCAVLRDWFGLVNHGYSTVGVGNSDSHSLGDEAGYPRNYVHVGHDDGGAVTDREIIDAIHAGRVTVSGGLILTYSDGTLPGDTLTVDASTDVELPVLLQSSTFGAATELVVYVNGVESERITLSEAAAETIDFDDLITVNVEVDSWVVLVAWGSARATADVGGIPFGFSNPVFLDVGGDGYTAPGVANEAALPMPTGFAFCN